MGDTVQVANVVPAQLPPVQVNEVAAGLQVAVSVAVPRLGTAAGAALRRQVGELANTPVPLKITLCGLPVALLVTFATPTRPAVALGVNVMLKLHDALAAKLGPQVLLTAKPPVGAMPAMASAALPVLVNVAVFGALLVPIACSENVSDVGANNTTGTATCVPIPLKLTV